MMFWGCDISLGLIKQFNEIYEKFIQTKIVRYAAK